MPGVKDENHAGMTISYNGVQFGGADSVYKMILPKYDLRGTIVYDDADRVPTHLHYVLNVQACVYHNSEAEQSAQIDAITQKLSAPRGVLSITGLGLGATVRPDMIWGPKPRSFQIRPIAGVIASQFTWELEFNVTYCSGQYFSAWNYETTCGFDFEGRETRTIGGYVMIPNNTVPYRTVVDKVRENIHLFTPANYRRVHTQFHENTAKNRLEFSFTDERLPGDAPPPGISRARGGINYAANWPFAMGQTSLSMQLTVMPGYSRYHALRVFLMAVIQQQNFMTRTLRDSESVVVPRQLSLHQGMFDDARQMSGSMTWEIAGCVERFLKNSELWEPVPTPDDAAWRDSVNKMNLWHNRGAGGVGTATNPGEDIIINVCSGVDAVNVGAQQQNQNKPSAKYDLPIECNFDEKHSWLAYDVRVTVQRSDEQTWLRRTTNAVSTVRNNGDTDPSYFGANFPGPKYDSTDPKELPVVEQNGRPMTYVLLQFKGLRAKFKPEIPTVKTVNGHPVFQVDAGIEAPIVAFEILHCPVYFVRAWIVYRYDGYTDSLKGAHKKATCLNTVAKEDY